MAARKKASPSTPVEAPVPTPAPSPTVASTSPSVVPAPDAPEPAPSATPAAEKLAADSGVDLADVTPTGVTGIILDDVKAAADRLAARKTLRKGTYTFDAPNYLGGVKVTLRAGEPVGEAMQAHIPAADLADLFDTYTPPAK